MVYGAEAEGADVFGRGLGWRGRSVQGEAVFQGLSGYPAPAFGEGGFAYGTTEVDHVYVLVEALYGVVDVLDHDGVWGDDFLGVWEPEFGACVEYLDFEAGFFEDFALDGLNGVFVGFDVSAGREPGFDFGMPVKRYTPAMDYEAGGGEVASDGLFSVHWILGLTLILALSLRERGFLIRGVGIHPRPSLPP